MNRFIAIAIICSILLFPANFAFADTDIETDSNIEPAEKTLPYNYEDTEFIPIKLNIIKEVSTKDPNIEGGEVEFRVINDVIYNKRTILQEGDIVKAKLETIITTGMNGFPAEIIIDNFQIPNIKQSQLISTYTKKGQNRCLWVYPLKWSLTLIPFVGSLTNLIMGGEARIKTTDIITIYYFPNWK